MDKSLHCSQYDNQLQDSLKHFISYPMLLPFIGNLWEEKNERVLFIAESHYLPKTSDGKSDSRSWYERDSSHLTKYDYQHVDTRKVVRCADEYAVKREGYCKAYSIFYNIKSAIFKTFDVSATNQTLFQNFAYYNYFQRPAEKTGSSIKNGAIDNEVAYQTLAVICKTIKPTTLIFLSKKAITSFKSEDLKRKENIFHSVNVHQVPHPSSAWWNRKSKAFNSSNPITGRAKFCNIIKGLDLKLV